MTLKYYLDGRAVDLLDPDLIIYMKARIMNWLLLSSENSWAFYEEATNLLKQHEKLPQGGRFAHKTQRMIAELYLSVRIPLHRKGIWKIKRKSKTK